MHYFFGKLDGKCKNCEHYRHWKENEVCARPLRKCSVYGITRSEASDWKAGYDACGLFPNRDSTYDREIIEFRIENKHGERQIDGQITLFNNV